MRLFLHKVYFVCESFEEFYFIHAFYFAIGGVMKVIKNINNNVSMCLDSQGREVVVFGKGLGFTKPPNTIDMERIEKTFYNIKYEYLDVLQTLDETVLRLSCKIIEYANHNLDYSFSNNVMITLADHIQFAIRRAKENIHIDLPIMYDVKNLYPDEMKIGMKALRLITDETNVQLPAEEAAAITLHLVNFGLKPAQDTQNNYFLVGRCIDAIERDMNITIDKTGFSYTRFATHMYYLFDRYSQNKYIDLGNKGLLGTLMKEYPDEYGASLSVCDALGMKLNDDEIVYLILHINRLCSSED